MLLRISTPSSTTAALPVAKDVLKAVALNDRVMVIGNRPGGGGPEFASGLVREIGGNRLEVDSALSKPGSNGGPIIRLETGEVIGVSSFAESRAVLVPDTAFATTSPLVLENAFPKWSGYLPDTVSKWEAIDPATWSMQVRKVKNFREASIVMLALIQCDIGTVRRNPRLNQMLERYLSHIKLAGISEASKSDEVRTLITFFKAFGNEGVKELTNETFYDYFRTNAHWDTNINEQLKFRAQILQSFKDVEGSLRAFQQNFHP